MNPYLYNGFTTLKYVDRYICIVSYLQRTQCSIVIKTAYISANAQIYGCEHWAVTMTTTKNKYIPAAKQSLIFSRRPTVAEILFS